jgi:hypothetical protein
LIDLFIVFPISSGHHGKGKKTTKNFKNRMPIAAYILFFEMPHE